MEKFSTLHKSKEVTLHAIQQQAHSRVDERGFVKSIGLLLKLINKFKIVAGLKTFAQVKMGRTKAIKVPTAKFPISLRTGTSDQYAFYQVFLYDEYNLEFVQDPSVIVDGGANIGLFTVLMKNKFPAAKVISIEPDPENFAQLQKNVAAYDDVVCENVGLWNKDAQLKVYDKYDLGKWAMVVEESASGTIKATSINKLMHKHALDHIDILKLDIESSEKVLFSGNYDYWLPRTRMIIIELHDSMESGCARQFFQVINKIFSDYTLAVKGENVIITNNDYEKRKI